MSAKRIVVSVCTQVVLLVCFVLPVQAKSLYWRNITVNGHLADTGMLHIEERQTIVFDGDWNGGERIFDVRPGQSFTFHGLFRMAEDGGRIPLEKGGLARVDHYDWSGGSTLRWRARLPQEPPFSNQPLTYVLEYSLGHILLEKEGAYVLDHDFGFPGRSGRIEKFNLTLSLDESWGQSGFPLTVQQHDIPPGQGVVVHRILDRQGQGEVLSYSESAAQEQQDTVQAAPLWFVQTGTALLFLFLVWRSASFFLHESRRGRFAALTSPDLIDKPWLAEHLFTLAPETVGATWDRRTSGHEVAAILARLVVERKMSSWLEPLVIPFFNWHVPGRYTLNLSLLQPREQFSGYERELIDGFFIDGDITDTRRIRKYYRRKHRPFHPVMMIRKPLERQVERLTKALHNPLQYRWLFIVAGLITAFFIILANGFLHQGELPLTITGGCTGLAGVIVGAVAGDAYRRRSDGLLWRCWLIHLVPMMLLGLFALFGYLGISALLASGLLFLCGTAIYSSFYTAKTQDSMEGVVLSKHLTAARNYMYRELRREQPELEDSWMPYLMAFGLGPYVDAWSKEFDHSLHPGHGYAPSSSPGGSGFSGGGGSFGGGGASGAWAAAAASLSSGASSSSSGGGVSGSSGGGGGGGW